MMLSPALVGAKPASGPALTAVRYSSDMGLTNASVTIPDSPLTLFSVWLNLDSIVNGGNTFVNFDYLNNEVPFLGIFNIGPGIQLQFGASFLTYVAATGAFPFDGNWHNLMFASDTNHAAGQKIFQLYLDDVPVSTTVSNDGPAFSNPTNGQTFTISDGFQQGAPITGEIFDYWLGCGQFLDLSVTANRRKFIDGSGKPMALGTDGELPTGTSPAVFCHGNASTFATNQGTGGAFTLTGTLTDAAGP
jgi:hypothetical protein